MLALIILRSALLTDERSIHSAPSAHSGPQSSIHMKSGKRQEKGKEKPRVSQRRSSTKQPQCNGAVRRVRHREVAD